MEKAKETRQDQKKVWVITKTTRSAGETTTGVIGVKATRHEVDEVIAHLESHISQSSTKKMMWMGNNRSITWMILDYTTSLSVTVNATELRIGEDIIDIIYGE